MSSKSITKFEKLTDKDILQLFVSLGSLPLRDSSTPQVDVKAYGIALEGIGKGTAQQAVRRILQGALDHVFFPNPVELRKVCEAVIEDELRSAKLRQRHRWEDDQPASAYVPATAEQKARVQALLKANGFRSWEDGRLTAPTPPARPAAPAVPDYSQDPVEISPALARTLARQAKDELDRVTEPPS